MPDILWDRCYGAIETLPPSSVPDGYATSAINVDLVSAGLMRPRIGYLGWVPGFTGGPTETIINAFVDRTDPTFERLWVFSGWYSGGTPLAHTSDSGGGWTARTLTDTPAITGSAPTNTQVTCCVYNGKTFIAYNSSVNRLHLWDGSACRRVGIESPVAATVANTGAGAYAATIRYYKVQMRLHQNADASQPRLASSELGAVVSFTPSGAGTAARVTKPTTVDSATHWTVYASADGVNYYDVSGSLDVATTTFDDSITPSTYSGYTIAEEAGLYVPPPSCRFLATNGERLFMAGAHETTATSLQTTPSSRRVWFTRPLGATDHGDDEAVTHTATSRYWVDIDNEDGGAITGLVSAIDGSIYVSTATSLWRLTDTGSSESPMAAERVVSGRGPSSHYTMTVSDATDGSQLYFAAYDGPYRYSPSTGLQYLGADVVAPTAAPNTLQKFEVSACQWDPQMRRISWVCSGADSSVYGRIRHLDPAFMSQILGEWRGGWTIDALGVSNPRFKCVVAHQDQLYILGGNSSNAPKIYSRYGTEVEDDGNNFDAVLISKSWMPGGVQNIRTEEPYLWKRRSQAVALSLSRNRGGSENTVTDSVSQESPGGTESVWHRHKVEGLVVADAASVELTLTISAPIINRQTRHLDGIDAVLIPYVVQERG